MQLEQQQSLEKQNSSSANDAFITPSDLLLPLLQENQVQTTLDTNQELMGMGGAEPVTLSDSRELIKKPFQSIQSDFVREDEVINRQTTLIKKSNFAPKLHSHQVLLKKKQAFKSGSQSDLASQTTKLGKIRQENSEKVLNL